MDKVRDDKDFTPVTDLDAPIVTPDTGIAGVSGDPVKDYPDNAADVVQSDSGNVIQAPDTSDEPNAVDAVTYVGKRVFSPHELNQSGEDKEYFHPDKGHKFDAPKDANDHALTPDIEVTPDNKVKRIE